MQAAFLLTSAANRSHPLAICPDFRRFAAAFCFPNPMVAVRLRGFAKDKPRLIQRVACANGLALLARHKRAFAAVVLLSAVGTDAVVLRVVPNAAALLT